jgi:hypothetical protein
MQFYSTTKKNEILLFAGKWMEVDNIILSDISQVQIVKNVRSLAFLGQAESPKSNIKTRPL